MRVRRRQFFFSPPAAPIGDQPVFWPGKQILNTTLLTRDCEVLGDKYGVWQILKSPVSYFGDKVEM